MVQAKATVAAAALCLMAACAGQQDMQAGTKGNPQDMTGEELRTLLADGLTLTLGGAGEGYTGRLTLEPDGTGVGAARFENGRRLDVTGTWTVEGDQFCRQWKFDDFKRECETWRKIGSNKVAVIIDGERVGVNSW